MRYPVWLLQTRVGEILWERRGLYWTYSAALFPELPGFVRLYYHGTDGCRRLGLFRKDGGKASLSGRISLRAAGNAEEAFAFTILEEAYQPPEAFSPRPELHFSARRLADGWEYCIPVSEIDDSALPYFCFFRPASIYERSCVLLTQDRHGNPYFPEVSP